MTKYPLAEKFLAPQGEGLYAGMQMAFMRVVGCSVGQKVCTACDTDFLAMRADLGGGVFDVPELASWMGACRTACITGGEPLDRDLRDLVVGLTDDHAKAVHVETSGTRHPAWLDPVASHRRPAGQHAVGKDLPDGRVAWRWLPMWITVSPKPGYRPEMVDDVADEVKVILGGLGDGPGWPTVEDAVRWADAGKLVYVQPRNLRDEPDRRAVGEAIAVVARWPQLRLSVQLHKFINTR